MKDKGTLFFVTIMCIILCGISFVSMVYAFRLAKIADEENVIYKDIVSTVEYTNGKSIEVTGSKKGNNVIKSILVKNTGEDPIYVDFLWESIDMSDPNGEFPFTYTIVGTSLTGESTLSVNSGTVPLDTSLTLTSGETIAPGDTASYSITISYTPNKANQDAFLYASVGVNVRH